MAPTCKALRSATLTLTSASGFITFPWPANNSDGTLSHRCEIASEGGEITQYSSGNLTKSNHVSDASQLHNRSALKINAHRREIFHDEEVQTQLRCYGIVPPFIPFLGGKGSHWHCSFCTTNVTGKQFLVSSPRQKPQKPIERLRLSRHYGLA